MGKRVVKNWCYCLLGAIFFCAFFVHAKLRVMAGERTVRVGVFEMKGFFEKGADEQPFGYGVDYLDRVAEKTGWSCEYIWAEDWNGCAELLRRKEADIMAPAEKTSELEKEFRFSSYNIGMECGALLTGSGDSYLSYEDFDSFRGIRVGCEENSIFEAAFLQYAQNKGFTPHIVPYKNTDSLITSLKDGEVDAVVTNLFSKTEETRILSKFGAAPFYFMLRGDDPLLAQELNDALEQIKIEYPAFDAELMKKYYPSFNYVPYTKAELDYIASAAVLTVGCRSDIRPVSYVDERTGEVVGITRDILDEISRISGLEFAYVALPEGNITYDYLRDQKLQLISSVEYNEENAHAPGLRLTSPYLKSEKVFVCGRDTRFDADASLRIAVATGSQTLISAIRRAYPNFEVINCDSLEACFAAVRKGQADALLQNQYAVTSYLAKPLYSDMILLPSESLADKHCLSPVLYQEEGKPDSLLDDSRLISILDKTISQLDERKVSKIIIEQTTEHQYRYTVGDFVYQYRFAIAVICVILAVLLGIFLYMLYIRREGIRITKKNEEKLRNIADNVNGGVVVLSNHDGLRITYNNGGFLKLLGYNPEEQLWGRKFEIFVKKDDRQSLAALVSKEASGSGRISLKLHMLRRDGGSIPVLCNGTVTYNGQESMEIYCVIMDISEQESLLESLYLEQEKYDTLISNSGEILFEVNSRKQKFKVSPLFEQKFGWRMDGMESAARDAFALPGSFRIFWEDRPLMEDAIRRTFHEKRIACCTVRIPKADESFHWCQFSLYPMLDRNGELVYILGKLLDVDTEVNSRRELEEMSRTDALTGLLNKAAFLEQARKYLEKENRKNTALVFIDVDNFKQVNDKLGHLTGDQAIQETADGLRLVFSENDIMARFGGDEFCILLKEIPPAALQEKLGQAVKKLQMGYVSEGKTVVCTVSIGAVYASDTKQELAALLQLADKAAYQAKEEGKNRFVLYGAEERTGLSRSEK